MVKGASCRRPWHPDDCRVTGADISDRDGHLTMIGRIGEIHDWLLGRF
jgi:hypothetical protein